MDLYLIAYALSDEEKPLVDALRERIAAKFGVQAALQIVPHLTIVMPFETEQRAMLVGGMRKLAAQQKPFVVPLTKFDSFEKSRVWFIDPVQSQGLADLHSSFRDVAKEVWKREQLSEGFEMHFHVTLSYKDVPAETHQRIGEMLKTEPLPIQSLNVSNISLLKHLGAGKGWEIVETFPFGTPDNTK